MTTSIQWASRLMNRRITLGFVMAMVLIASGFIISFYSYNQYGDDMERVRHTYQVTGRLETILSLVKDVETSSRGYAMTNDTTYFEITVTDNGIGFDEKYLDHIFKVFQRLHGKSAFEGTGIGLAICKRVVMYHHGHITARSRPGQGTSFVVVLPKSQLLQHYDRPTSAEAYSYPAG